MTIEEIFEEAKDLLEERAAIDERLTELSNMVAQLKSNPAEKTDNQHTAKIITLPRSLTGPQELT